MFSERRRSIAAELSSLPEQARQQPDPQNTPEYRSTDGDDRFRYHVRHSDEWIVGGLRCLIIWHFGCFRVCTDPHCRTVCAKTRMNRIVKTPMPTPMSTNSVPGAPSLARGRAGLCGRVMWLAKPGTIRWRKAPSLVKWKTAIADLRKTATSYRTATANKISRRNPTSHSKVRIKGL